jgi:hypothetical protein
MMMDLQGREAAREFGRQLSAPADETDRISGRQYLEEQGMNEITSRRDRQRHAASTSKPTQNAAVADA